MQISSTFDETKRKHYPNSNSSCEKQELFVQQKLQNCSILRLLFNIEQFSVAPNEKGQSSRVQSGNKKGYRINHIPKASERP